MCVVCVHVHSVCNALKAFAQDFTNYIYIFPDALETVLPSFSGI